MKSTSNDDLNDASLFSSFSLFKEMAKKIEDGIEKEYLL